MTGNQHRSRRGELVALLYLARDLLHDGYTRAARNILDLFWQLHAKAPASTRRRWKCGR